MAILHPLQQVFLNEAALQCGICTPGILVAAKNLLEREPDPTEEQVRYWLAGNLCRCTGYDKIVRAVQSAAARLAAVARAPGAAGSVERRLRGGAFHRRDGGLGAGGAACGACCPGAGWKPLFCPMAPWVLAPQ